MTDRLIINLPCFPGFYESLLSHEIDHIEEQEAEWRAEQDQEEQPEHLRLTAREFADILWRCSDYSAAYHDLAREWVEAFDYVVKDEIDLALNLEYESMDSPREYNFATDRVYAHIPWRRVLRLFAISKADKHETLSDTIRRRFTSRSGFISFYPDDLQSWLAKPLADWDHNELGTLLLAALQVKGFNPEYDDLAIYYRTVDGETAYTAYDNCVDWEKFDSLVADAREEKLEAWRAENPEIEPPYRCPDTPDLFASHM